MNKKYYFIKDYYNKKTWGAYIDLSSNRIYWPQTCVNEKCCSGIRIYKFFLNYHPIDDFEKLKNTYELIIK